MRSHAPPDHACPFCRIASAPRAVDDQRLVHTYDDVFVTVNPKWWPGNAGALLVVPTAHFENVYELPAQVGTPLQQAIRDAAYVLKAHFGLRWRIYPPAQRARGGPGRLALPCARVPSLRERPTLWECSQVPTPCPTLFVLSPSERLCVSRQTAT